MAANEQKNNEMHEKMLALLTRGLDTIMITGTFKGKDYLIPACRRNDNEHYRISHSTLLYFYRLAKKANRDLCIRVSNEIFSANRAYCIAACSVHTAEGDSDLYIGENAIDGYESVAEKFSPYQIALNRAEDKAIYTEVFGLQSRFYDSNGDPVLFTGENVQYDATPDDVREGNEKDAAQEDVTPDEAPMRGRQDDDLLNSVEKEELCKLGEEVIQIKTKSGEVKTIQFAKMNNKVLKCFADSEATVPEKKEKMLRLLELRRKGGLDAASQKSKEKNQA